MRINTTHMVKTILRIKCGLESSTRFNAQLAFVEKYISDQGLVFNGNGKCPICGIRTKSLYKHLLGNNRCGKEFRKMVENALRLYHNISFYIEKTSDGRHRCRICGFKSNKRDVVLHIYNEHLDTVKPLS